VKVEVIQHGFSQQFGAQTEWQGGHQVWAYLDCLPLSIGNRDVCLILQDFPVGKNEDPDWGLRHFGSLFFSQPA
jgi:hypothetical protein